MSWNKNIVIAHFALQSLLKSHIFITFVSMEHELPMLNYSLNFNLFITISIFLEDKIMVDIGHETKVPFSTIFFGNSRLLAGSYYFVCSLLNKNCIDR